MREQNWAINLSQLISRPTEGGGGICNRMCARAVPLASCHGCSWRVWLFRLRASFKDLYGLCVDCDPK